MSVNFKTKLFLENCFMPAKIDGSKWNLENTEILLVGITGLGSVHERNDLQSIWINGEILSPNFIANNACACKSHIGGIITQKGEMRFLESVYDFLAHEEDCFEYILQARENKANLLEFEGELTSRLGRNNFQPVKEGKIYLSLNPFWTRTEDGGESVNPSLPRWNQHYINGICFPKFWKIFLNELEKQGYDHSYTAILDNLKRE